MQTIVKNTKITFLDFYQVFKKLPNNLDSLLLATNTNLEKLNEYFYKQKKTEYTILLLTGGWVESMYITSKITKKNPNELLKNRIGEQKIILEQCIIIFTAIFLARQGN